jgi:Fe-S cluster assembly iron-binding protein IscA
MLTITETASEALEQITSSDELPDTAGVRIAYSHGEDGRPALQLMLAAEPEPQDEVVAESSFSLFLEPQAAAALDDKVLDAQLDPTGRVGFVVAEQT